MNSQLVTLIKVKSNHNNLDRDRYTGYILESPMPGRQFVMATNEEGKLWTTKVRHTTFNEDGSITFETKNSTYRIEPAQKDAIVLNALEQELMTVFITHGIKNDAEIFRALGDLRSKLLDQDVSNA